MREFKRETGEEVDKDMYVDMYINSMTYSGFGVNARDEFLINAIGIPKFSEMYSKFPHRRINYWFYVMHNAYISSDMRIIVRMKRRVIKQFNRKVGKSDKIRYYY